MYVIKGDCPILCPISPGLKQNPIPVASENYLHRRE